MLEMLNYTVDLSTDLGSIRVNGEKHKRSFYQKALDPADNFKITIETDIGNIELD